jgi:hypothetical protein
MRENIEREDVAPGAESVGVHTVPAPKPTETNYVDRYSLSGDGRGRCECAQLGNQNATLQGRGVPREGGSLDWGALVFCY